MIEQYLAKWQRVRMANNSRRKVYPPRVDDVERHWAVPPPTLSARCRHVLKRIADGWRPRLIDGYCGNSEYLGVYIWEYLFVVSPALNGGRCDVRGLAFEIGEDGAVRVLS